MAIKQKLAIIKPVFWLQDDTKCIHQFVQAFLFLMADYHTTHHWHFKNGPLHLFCFPILFKIQHFPHSHSSIRSHVFPSPLVSLAGHKAVYKDKCLPDLSLHHSSSSASHPQLAVNTQQCLLNSFL